jgi:hypothetical protein
MNPKEDNYNSKHCLTETGLKVKKAGSIAKYYKSEKNISRKNNFIVLIQLFIAIGTIASAILLYFQYNYPKPVKSSTEINKNSKNELSNNPNNSNPAQENR